MLLFFFLELAKNMVFRLTVVAWLGEVLVGRDVAVNVGELRTSCLKSILAIALPALEALVLEN